MADVEMVVVDGIRYRKEDAPKRVEKKPDEKPVENKVRTTRTK